ncbi:hypothetical protein SAMN05428959_10790 [Duganella sp. CF517]|uniref:Sbal_3080 family lipoprotein n=1 Tax=Duganella sp. CF517 TaxID=1881038 RepID=UPI0008CB8C77|nr:Sbal_3080 family lipoprotein [Duganella sp. CF517]SEO37796.1 hypothetical protein SAMN05428959_10790 [Duganella sp. CF517]
MFNRITLLAAVAALSSGCAIQQTVKPVERFADKTVCIVDNPAVREGFLIAYKQALEAKGFAAQKIAADASIIQCPITSTYTANWRWDLAMYMVYANIKVYNNGKPIGEVVYDAKSAGMNTAKFITADTKIKELVDQLFPATAGQ